ncbi:MAG TPA: glutathione S-transferase [Devosia sp.]|nr:glutathione S-transferase [Devosia sp.]
MYRLYYWTGIPGRGEFVRLALEAAGAKYQDIARQKGDGVIEAFTARTRTPSFAPPFLVDGDVVVGQTAAILFYLGPKLGLAPRDPRLRLWAHQIQLTIADFVVEAHDSHHPVGSGLYYEQQKREAKRRAKEFREERAPKFLGWFETVLRNNIASRKVLVGRRPGYVDFSLFQVVEGLAYAYPRLWARIGSEYPLVTAHRQRIAEYPALQTYFRSQRRLDFNTGGLFRHYPELDP